MNDILLLVSQLQQTNDKYMRGIPWTVWTCYSRN